jgi:SAM-dependent methyltransferase
MQNDYIGLNRRVWDNPAPDWVTRGREMWAAAHPVWGIWRNPESEIELLPDVAGLRAVELGCGTGYVSTWLRQRDASPVGLDSSWAQLQAARTFQREFDIGFPLVLADAEHTPFADESFDFAISEYGASTWCDPFTWIPEAARILRPGGRLAFVTGTSLLMMCFSEDDEEAPAGTTLQKQYFGMKRLEWHQIDGTIRNVGFQLGHGEMIRLLRSCGFEIEDLVEMRAPEGSTPRVDVGVTYDWARRWPSVEGWRARKTG